MKKSLLTVLVVLFVSGAYAQVGAGIKAGVNFANQDIEDVETKSRTGYHFGAFLEFSATDNIAIQPEVLFTKQGSTFELNQADVDFDVAYLSIPVLLKFKFVEILNLHVGPQFGILASAEMNGNDIKDRFKSSDISLAIGAGVNLPMGIVGGVRYVYGLTDINDIDDVDASSVKNKTLQIYVGLKLF